MFSPIKIDTQTYKTIRFHILFWIGFLFVTELMYFANYRETFYRTLRFFPLLQLPNIISVYVCLYVYHKYTNPLKKGPLAIGVFVAYAATCLTWYIVRYFFAKPITTSHMFWYIVVGSTWLFMQYAFFAFCYYYVKESLRHQKQLQQTERAKHEAEYAFLRTQINPHFLNNTLNLFYAKFLPISDKLAECTLKLSQLMHYTLRTDKDNTRSLLSEELAHANQLIEINKLSRSKTAQIELEVNGNTENILIMPFVIITLLEYAFEYEAGQASRTYIKLRLDISTTSDTLTLSTCFEKEKLIPESVDHSTLSGLKKRLFNHYNNRFEFNLIEDQTKSSIELKLPLLFNKELKHLQTLSNSYHNSEARLNPY